MDRKEEIKNMHVIYDGCYFINRYTDLRYYQEDDSWRVIDWAKNRNSIPYKSFDAACNAYAAGKVKWEKGYWNGI